MTNGIFPVDYGSDVGLVRLLIPDVATDSGTMSGDFLFSDAAIEGLLSLAIGSRHRAAGLALNAIASDQALLLKNIQTNDLKVDGPSLASSLRAQATVLFEQALISEADFQIAYPSDKSYVIPTNNIIWSEVQEIAGYRNALLWR